MRVSLTADPVEEAERSLLRQTVRCRLESLPERERLIVERRFGFQGEPQSLEAPFGHAGHKLHQWMFDLEAWREGMGQKGGEVNASTLVIEEAATSRLGDYAGIYNKLSGIIRVRYDADAYVGLHEAAHIWFNGDLFRDRWIGEASDNRRRMLADAYEEPGTLQRIRVHVPDRPGVLAGITQALGAERINIEDFELQHLSRERGGTLTLLVGGEDEAERAAKILEAQGYHVVISPVLE